MQVRRVVSDNDKSGRSFIKWDAKIQGRAGRPGFERVDLWATETLPAQLTDHDPVAGDIGTTVAGGSVCRFCRFEPGVAQRWHTTDSIDYGIVLSGEIVMELDEGEVLLKQGDVMIQRATNHNWVNKSTESCIICFVLVATEGGKPTGW